MAALRDIKNKINAVKKTGQITRAMNMVAAAKLRGVQGKNESFRPYAHKLGHILEALLTGVDPRRHPLLATPLEVTEVALILLTADRGLCGSFNLNLLAAAERFLKERRAQNQQVRIYVIGRKGRDYFKRRKIEVAEALVGAMNVVDFDLALTVAQLGLNAYMAGEVAELYLIYSHFNSMISQVPTVERLLPITIEAGEKGPAAEKEVPPADYLVEPSAEEILVDLLPRYLNVRVYHGLLQTATSEHAARMTAMDNASKNCRDLVADLTLLYNKARQAAITTELMDIVGGAEALKAS
jgi:F-type H+-transporting ATPase subunit gamma